MINAVLIDDEVNSCEIIEELILLTNSKINVVGKAHTVKDAVELIDTQKPDLVFLDIQMPTGTGFEVLETIHHRDFKLVFITAHEEYAITAFKHSAIDYLLKPVLISDFKDTVARIQHYFDTISSSDNKAAEEQKIKNFLSNSKERLILPIGSGLGFKVVNINDIVRCQSDKNYTEFYFVNGEKIVSSKTMKAFESVFENLHFYRIHRSHIINLKHIVGLKKGAMATVQMSDGSDIEISREKKADFFDLIDKL